MDKRVIDEIKLVKHLTGKLKRELKGRGKTIIYSNPADTILAGVIFPNLSFNEAAQVKNTYAVLIDDNDDDSPKMKNESNPLRKSNNIGIDFRLRKPAQSEVAEISVFLKFAIYIRLLPNHKEQLVFLDKQISTNDIEIQSEENEDLEENIENVDTDNDEEANNAVEREKNTITEVERYDLAFKYIRRDIKVGPFTISFNPGELNGEVLTFDEEVREAINNNINEFLIEYQNQLYSIKDDKSGKRKARASNKTRKMRLTAPIDTEVQYQEALNAIIDNNIVLPNWQAAIKITSSEDFNNPNVFRTVISLTNETDFNPNSEHPLEFYDCELAIKVLNSKIEPFEFDAVNRDYRYKKYHYYSALGNNCTILPDTPADILKTETIPEYFQKHYRTSDRIKVMFSELENDKEIFRVLDNVKASMEEYLNEWNDYIVSGYMKDKLSLEELHKCEEDKANYESEIKAFQLGVKALRSDTRLLDAFCLMNKVFRLSWEEKAKNKNSSPVVAWRLFQIVFIVKLLASLYARETDQEEFVKQLEMVDILWFPTGGGKTEAYFGLIITALFYDRLRGKARGTTTWLRFPLRMLSKQQLDRLAKMLAQAELIRRSDDKLSANRGEPFSLGYFVGSGNTPNFIYQTEMSKYVSNEKLRRKKFLQIHKCPFCNSKINIEVNEDTWRAMHVCSNEMCISREILPDGSLPIYVTDAEIYRYLPSVICGTVDKLAILGRYGEFSHIFGQVQGKCPKHGYFSGGECLEKRLPSSSRSCKVDRYEPITLISDPTPALIIQDELHLLKEELGTFNGHYEGFVAEISRKIGNGKLPKIIAATATIEGFEEHIKHLYLRKPQRYPQPGYRLGESFYATSTPEIDRRLYLGLLPHLKSKEQTICRCLDIYHREIQNLYKNAATAIAELKLESFDSVQAFEKYLALYDLSVAYVTQKATGNDIDYRIRHILEDQYIKDGLLPIQTVLLTGDDDMEKVGSVIDRIEDEIGVKLKEKIHTLIATNLISHGVDLERINAMFLSGMPSKIAEYIQASSRTARNHVGFALVCFNSGELRERSLYQYFVPNHTYLDRLVEPVPIHRLASYALEKTIPGLLSGLLLNVYARNPVIWKRYKALLEKTGEVKKVLIDQQTRQSSEQILTEESLTEDLYRIIGVNKDSNWFPLSMKEEVRKRIKDIVEQCISLIKRDNGNLAIKDEKVLNPLSSFRDIDAGVNFYPYNDTGVIENKISS